MKCICGESRVRHVDDGFCPETGCFAFRPSREHFNCRCQIVADIDKRLPVEVLERMTQEQRVRLAATLFDEDCRLIMRLHAMPPASARVQ